MSGSICQPPECFILQLPDEVLVDIIDRAASWLHDPDTCAFHELYATRWALTLVCRRFHSLALPILYSRIYLGHLLQTPRTANTRWYEASGGVTVEDAYNPVPKAVSLLRRSIEESPGLGPLCKEMEFDFEACVNQLESLYWLCAVFVNTRSLRVHHGFEATQFPQTCACLMTALVNMRHLERLAITGCRRPVNIQHVLPVLEGITVDRYPGLKEIMLVGITRSVLPVRIQLQGPGHRAPFTRVTISDYYDQPQTIRVLLKRPARLEHFTYLGIRRLGWHALDLRTLWSYLVPHMLTLETIHIGSMSSYSPQDPLSDRLSGVDFTLFERLRFLSLSYWATGSDTGEGSILAPHLETFEWVFDAEDERPMYLDRFGKQEEAFLRRLADAAVARGIPLRKIRIVFTPVACIPPDSAMSWGQRENELEYPWDRMDRVAGGTRKLGISLTYNKPSITREEFDEIAEITRSLIKEKAAALAV